MDPSCLVSTVQAAGGGVMCGGYFLAHFGPLSTNWALFKRHSLLKAKPGSNPVLEGVPNKVASVYVCVYVYILEVGID